MKKFWLCLVLAITAGTACAWTVNYQRFAHRFARFGPFTMDGDVTAENVMKVIDKDVVDELARVELPLGSDYDFGAMAPEEKGEHTFVVKNVGEGDLVLRIGSSTCKCTIGTLDNETLGPGEQTDVKMEWTVPATSDAFSQSAQLLTNDPSKIAINLGIHGKVISDIEIVPKEWSFGEIATGEPIELSAVVYSHFDNEIVPTKQMFSDDYINELSEFLVEPFQPSEADGVHSRAKQAFRVTVKIKPGLRQGAVSQNFLFGFQHKDKDGTTTGTETAGDDPNFYSIASMTGSIIGALSLRAGPIKGRPGGGYIYDFGRIGKDDSLIGKTFVVLKGSDRENTKLRIGEVYPDNVVKATLGEPKGSGPTTLYSLQIELIPGSEVIARQGKNKDDYGSVWIESDNPKITKMRVALKFLLEPR